MALVPCPACTRHVRASESQCPFCHGALPTQLKARAVPAANRRLDRFAAFTFAATLAVTGCTAGTSEEAESQDNELGSIQPMYGMPAPEDAGPKKDGGKKDGGKADGGKPSDGGKADASPCDTDKGPKDNGGVFAMYGAPAVIDVVDPCPAEDGGSVQPMYGMPAPADSK